MFLGWWCVTDQGCGTEVVAGESVGAASGWGQGSLVGVGVCISSTAPGVRAVLARAGILLFSPEVSPVGADGGHWASSCCLLISSSRWLAGIQD